MSGQRLGDYEITAPLGRGGMGVVYRGRAPDGSAVALKVLARSDPEHLARFEREARLLGSFGREDGFVPLLARGSSPSGPWFAMPLLEGGTLRERLARGPLGVAETRELGRALGAALGAAHARGVVHRDLKPENVLFDAEGRPLIADLGLAKHFDAGAPGASQSVDLTRTGTFRGTAGYMAPEQIGEARLVGPPADVFALGAILYECLAGGPAFAADSVIELLQHVCAGRFEPLGPRRRDAPRALIAAIERALSLDPERRPQDGFAFARTLTAESRSRALTAALVLTLALGAGGLGAALLRGSPPAAARPASANATPTPPAKRVSRIEQAAALIASSRAKSAAHDGAGALRDADAAIALVPELAEAWLARGVARGESKDWAGLIADTTRALELAPDLADAFAHRAEAHSMRGELEPQLADADRAIALDPRSKLGWFTRAVGFANRLDHAASIAAFDKVLEIDPDDPAALGNRSTEKIAMNDLDGALADATRAVEAGPKFAPVWTARALALLKRGDAEHALADATRALDLDPEYIMAYSARGEARALTGDKKGALADLERFFAKFPPFDERTEKLRSLLDELRRP